MISRDELSENLIVNFTLEAIPFIPLVVETTIIGDNNEEEVVTIDDVTSDSEVVEFSISNSEVPQGTISVKIRIRYQGDDLHDFSNFSDSSNAVGKNLSVPL